MLELLAFAAVLGAAAAALLRRSPRRAWGPALAVLASGAAGLALWRPALPTPAERGAPPRVRGGGWAGSDACRSCHPAQHASWRASFHRTMTQVARPAAFAAPFARTELLWRGWRTVLEPRGPVLWVDTVDPLWAQEVVRRGGDPYAEPHPPRLSAPIVMTTGSHHLQVYWVRRPDGALTQVPWVWFRREGRFVPVTASFLQPPGGGLGSVAEWNSNCIACHSVGGEPRIDLAAQRADTRAAELGIACEACHGPAEAHVRANRDPRRRYRLHRGDRPDPTVVNPRRLPARASAEVCGQCHSVWVERDLSSYLARGKPYRAGGRLAAALHVVRFEPEPREEWLRRWLAGGEDRYAEYFWRDGTVRVTGREYNGLLESACFQRGEMSCLSCHSMHESDPDDQLAAGREADGSCLSCHGGFRGRVEEHTRHRAGSSGSSCLNCHMPYTTWGLFTAIRSHRIDSPSAAVSARTGRPNACNQCHLDRSLGWAAGYLTDWYGQPPVALSAISAEEREVAASLLWLLAGDAAQRALAAWSLGWAPAREAAGEGWQAPFLARALADPYAAVRHAGARSLQELPGFRGFRFDFVPAPGEQGDAVARALSAWRRGPPPPGQGARTLFDRSGRPDAARIARLAARRDDRPVILSE